LPRSLLKIAFGNFKLTKNACGIFCVAVCGVWLYWAVLWFIKSILYFGADFVKRAGGGKGFFGVAPLGVKFPHQGTSTEPQSGEGSPLDGALRRISVGQKNFLDFMLLLTNYNDLQNCCITYYRNN
jgi:hypothetical protein